eukprot:g15768.t1
MLSEGQRRGSAMLSEGQRRGHAALLEGQRRGHAALSEEVEPRPLPLPPGDEELNEPALSFLATLASSSSEEIELQLQDRMAFSKKAVARIVEVFDKLHRRIEDLCQKIN